ncbi:MAG: replicative DNA helicase [Planctomycetota bacterium]|jgi:replicative DNA helicase|nr:replicative DNA helicase [Planctomycetota bacterium]
MTDSPITPPPVENPVEDDYQPESEEYQPPDIPDTSTTADDSHGALYNLEAEQAFLGGLIIEPTQFDLIDGKLTPEDFFSAAHATVFRAMLAVRNQHPALDPVLIRDELRAKGQLENIGGKEALMRLTDSVISGAHTEHYAEVVKELSALRRVIQISNESITQAAAPGGRSLDVISEMEKKIHDVAAQNFHGNIESVEEILHRLWTDIDNATDRGLTGLSTGFLGLDDLLTGLHPDELIIVAGRPAMGKTTFALNIARNIVLESETPVAIFTLEMGAKDITSHILSAQARVQGQKLRKLNLNREDFARLTDASEKLEKSPLWIDDTPAISLVELRGKCRHLQVHNQLKLVIIDYLQLMTASNLARGRSREQEVSEISRGLKALAKELHIPVIALSQLSRKPEGRHDPKPILSDLRESGAIEQDADVVMMLHRPDYYKTDDQPGVAEIIVAKQRNGPTDMVRLSFLKDVMRFENYAGDHQGD